MRATWQLRISITWRFIPAVDRKGNDWLRVRGVGTRGVYSVGGRIVNGAAGRGDVDNVYL